MITAQDAELHTPNDVDYHFAETNYFSFYIPEHQLVCSIYTVIRPSLGVSVSEIIIFNELDVDRTKVLYFDSHQHLPAPTSFLHYKLPNGLEVRCVNPPRDYRIDYVGTDDTEFHLDIRGLMDPFDIHDPAMSPLAPANRADQIAKSGFGAGYAGHFDMTVRVTGTLKLYGRSFDVDCVDTMDHSWGARTERNMSAMCWSHGHFGEDYCWHVIWKNDVFADAKNQYTVAHGYVLEKGKVYGLKSGSMVVTRAGVLPVSLDISLVDKDDRTHKVSGRVLANHNWICYTPIEVHHTFFELNARGDTGYGVIQEIFPIDMIARRRGRAFVESLG